MTDLTFFIFGRVGHMIDRGRRGGGGRRDLRGGVDLRGSGGVLLASWDGRSLIGPYTQQSVS